MYFINYLDKAGTAGLLLTAIFSPCCFPLFAFVASSIGLGTYELFGSWTMWIFQAMVIVILSGFFISYKIHQCTYPLILAVPGSILIFYGYYFDSGDDWIYFIYIGMFALMTATGINYYRYKLHNKCNSCSSVDNKSGERNSTLTCPECGYKKTEVMPRDSCLYFYECNNCKEQLKPFKNKCCVFCSYGTVKCPSSR